MVIHLHPYLLRAKHKLAPTHHSTLLSVTSDSEGEHDDDSEVSDTAEDVAAALDGALLEEDDDDYRSEDDANTTGTATPEAEDPYHI